MRYCVLGGGGSFGLAVSRYLLKKPGTERVLAIGRNAPKHECFTLNTGAGDKRYSYKVRHLTYELDLLIELLDAERPDVIINFAAQGEGATSFNHSWRYFETNTVGLVRLVEALSPRDRDSRIFRLSHQHARSYPKRFLHIGTSELYGSTAEPATEDHPIKPTSPYAASKAAFDLYLLALHAKTGFPCQIIRPSNCYGRGQQLHRIIPKAFVCGLTGRKFPLHGGGVALKSYMHTHDLSTAIECVLESGSLGHVYNAAPERSIQIGDIVEKIAFKLGLNGVSELCDVTGDRAHQDSRYWLDSSKLRALGWRPTVGWSDGLEEMLAWAENYLPVLKELPTEFEMRG